MTDEKKCPCDALIKVQETIEKHNERLSKGDSNFLIMDLKLSTITTNTDDIKKDVKSLMTAPGKRWESFICVLLNVSVVIILGYIATHLGLK